MDSGPWSGVDGVQSTLRNAAPSLHKNSGALPAWHLEALAAWIPFGLILWALLDRANAHASNEAEMEPEFASAETEESSPDGRAIAMVAVRGQNARSQRPRQTIAEWMCM
jgi:hypothetical protein